VVAEKAFGEMFLDLARPWVPDDNLVAADLFSINDIDQARPFVLIGVVLVVALVLLVPWFGPATKSRSGRLARIEGVGGGWAGVNGAGGVDEDVAVVVVTAGGPEPLQAHDSNQTACSNTRSAWGGRQCPGVVEQGEALSPFGWCSP
jgi:hypothetical protein